MKFKNKKISTAAIAGAVILVLGGMANSKSSDAEAPETVTISTDELLENKDTNGTGVLTYKDPIEVSSENVSLNSEKEPVLPADIADEVLQNLIKEAGEPNNEGYVTVNDNAPFFTNDEIAAAADNSYEIYPDLDELGRCKPCVASVGKDLMPTEERGSIGMVKPTGWVQNKYPGLIGSDNEPPYLYNRSHLIAFCLTAEGANEHNLITGTRYMNLNMTQFEIKVAQYVENTGDRVLYRSTPVFEGEDNLLASGVLLEARSCNSDDVSFCVYLFNVQPGVGIDYKTGDNWLLEEEKVSENKAETEANTLAEATETAPASAPVATPDVEVTEAAPAPAPITTTYVINENTKKFHYGSCSHAQKISSGNRRDFEGNRDDLVNQGYVPCKVCKP